MTMRRFIVAICCLQMAFPLSVFSRTLPRPNERLVKPARSYLQSVGAGGMSGLIQRELPVLKADGVVSGDARIEVQTTVDGQRLMLIDQGNMRVLLDWNSFDIAENNLVKFNQPGKNAIAINRIFDQQPSQIRGNIEANGSVWLLNKNGIIFGENSQINTSGLIAAAMDLNGLEMDQALTDEKKALFQNESLSLFSAIDNSEPFLLNAKEIAEGTGDIPRIIVAPGASINSTNQVPVLMAAPEVINEGSISSDGGQVVLAGTKKELYLALTKDADEVVGDLGLRGYIVEVNSGKVINDQGEEVESEGGVVVNTGVLQSYLGNVTLVSQDIIQAGEIRSSTAVDVDGSIRLMARDQAALFKAGNNTDYEKTAESLHLKLDEVDGKDLPIGQKTGNIFFKEGSSTRIDIVRQRLDESGQEVVDFAVDGQTRLTADNGLKQKKSKLLIEGNNIVMEERARIDAPSADLTLRAYAGGELIDNRFDGQGESQFIMDEGAVIDVSGTQDTLLDAERNMVEVFYTSNETKDAPQQKDGALLRRTLVVDIRKGTPLFDITPFTDLVLRTASERNTAGGSIDIQATGHVHLANNATLDVSGGKTAYESGIVESSLLFNRRGYINIADADPNDNSLSFGMANGSFSSVVNHPTWGDRESFRTGPRLKTERLYRPGYDDWDDAGSINLRSPSMDINGGANLWAMTHIGPYERQDVIRPRGGSLNINLGEKITRVNIVADQSAEQLAEALREDAVELLAQQLESSGAESISIDTMGQINVVDDVHLALHDNGSLVLKASDMNIAGDIHMAGGDIRLAIGESTRFIGDGDVDGNIHVSGNIDVSGRWINDEAVTHGARATEPLTMDAGTISLSIGSAAKGANQLNVAESTTLKANAGAWRSIDGKLSYGEAGRIHIGVSEGTHQLSHAGTYQALDTKQGGTLSIRAPGNVLISQSEPPAAAMEEASPSPLYLTNTFFSETEVGQFEITSSLGDVLVDGTAEINLSHTSLELKEGVATIGSKANPLEVFNVIDPPSFLRSPGRLSLEAKQSDINTNVGNITIEEGAVITGPAKSQVSLLANRQIWMDGTIDIVGGHFNATLERPPNINSSSGDNYIILGDQANINLASGIVAAPNKGAMSNDLLVDAGSVTLLANFGSVGILSQALLNLSGGVATQKVQVNGRGALVDRAIPLAAGTLKMEAEKGLFLSGNIQFGQPNASHTGGVLDLFLNPNGFSRAQESDLPTLVFKLGNDSIEPYLNDIIPESRLPSALFENEAGLINQGTAWVSDDILNGARTGPIQQIRIAIDHTKINPNQIANNKLARIAPEGTVNIAARGDIILDATWLDLSAGHLNLEAPRVMLGKTSIDPELQQQAIGYIELPSGVTEITGGEQQLTVNSQFLDLQGNLTISGTDNSIFNIAQAIRVLPQGQRVGVDFDITQSELNSFQSVTFNTPLIWTATLADYHLNLQGDNSVLSVNRYFDPVEQAYTHYDEPLISAGGALSLTANDINIDSRLATPFGQLNVEATEQLLLGKNSQLSVAGEGTVPFGRILAEDIAWIYQFPDNTALAKSLSEKRISLKGNTVTVEQGSIQDVSGGGEVYGREFIAGLGGSEDILAGQDYRTLFAIVPSQKSGVSAYDMMEFIGSAGTDENNRSREVPYGTQFEVAGSSLLANGSYTVLPANYALVPGAILVSSLGQSEDFLQAGFTQQNTHGAEIATGRFKALGDQSNHRWQRFLIEPGREAHQRATYRIKNTDSFYEDTQPGVATVDNGRLQLAANQSLNFSGQVLSNADSPVGASLDVLSDRDVLIGDIASGDQLLVSPSLFTSSGADSILVGAERVWNDGVWEYQSTVNSITLDNAVVEAQELLLTANNTVRLINNSQINNTAEASFDGNHWRPGTGVSLLSSTAVGSQLQLNQLDHFNGELLIDGGSQVSAIGSIAVVYDGDTALQGLDLRGGRFQLASDEINIGTGAAATLSGTLLSLADQVALRAGEGIAFISDLSVDLGSVIFDTPEIRVSEGRQVAIQSDSLVTFRGDDNVAAGGALTHSSVSISAPVIRLEGAEDMQFLNVNASSVVLNAREALLAADKLQVETSGQLQVKTPVLAADQSAQLGLQADGLLSLEQSGVALSLDELGALNYHPGASFHLTGNQLAVNTAISARSGLIAMTSTEGDLHIGEMALLDASPFEQVFPDGIRRGPGGIITADAKGHIDVAQVNRFIFGQSSTDGALMLRTQGQLRLGAMLENTPSLSGVDFSLQADRLGSAQDWQTLLMMNRQGFNGDIDWVFMGNNSDITLAAGETIEAESLSVLTAGQIQLAGDIHVTAAKRDLTLLGQQGLSVQSTAQLAVTAAESGAAIALKLLAPEGGVTVSREARLTTPGKLVIAKKAEDTSTVIDLDNSDVIGGAIAGNDVVDLYAYTRKDDADGSINQSDVENYISQAISAAAITSLNIDTVYDVSIKPWLDIVAPGDLVLTANTDVNKNPISQNQINLYTEDMRLRTAQDDPGWLSLRAAGAIDLQAGLTDGIDYAESTDYGAWSFMRDSESWSMSLVTGAKVDNSLHRSQVLTGGDLTMAENTFIRTGTGDIDLYIAGDLIKQQGAAIYTVGKTTLMDINRNPIQKVDSGGRQLQQPFTDDLTIRGQEKLLGTFSGFGVEAGDVNIQVDGDLVNHGDVQTPNSFTLVLGFENDEVFNDFPSTVRRDYQQSMRAWGFSIVEIEGGIHSIGGGNVNVDVGGDILNTSFSTPGAASGLFADTSKELVIYPGGFLSVNSLGNIHRATFSSDHGGLDVRASGDIKNGVAGEESSLLVTGSSMDASITAGGELVLDGANNSLIMSRLEGSTSNRFYRRGRSTEDTDQKFNDEEGSQETIGSYFYHGYEDMSLSVTSVGGDMLYTADPEMAKGLMASDVAGDTFNITAATYKILPSSLHLTSLGGSVLLGGAAQLPGIDSTSTRRVDGGVFLFPSANAELSIKVSDHIGGIDYKNVRGENDNTINIYLADMMAEGLLPSINDFMLSFAPGSKTPLNTGTLFNLVTDVGSDEDRIHSNTLINRLGKDRFKFYAMKGDIGGVQNFKFTLPHAIDFYAGNDITNIDFDIQHSDANDISLIRAGNNIDYPLVLNEEGDAIQNAGVQKGIKVSGPGDVIIAAGNEIRLSASDGIYSNGDSENPVLPEQGANLHIYAGYIPSPDISPILGNGLSNNESLLGLSGFGFGVDELNTISMLSWFETAMMQGSHEAINHVFLQVLSDKLKEQRNDPDFIPLDNLSQAQALWAGLEPLGQQQLATRVLKNIALQDPGFIVAHGDALFKNTDEDEAGFANQTERTAAFKHYWDTVSGLIVLDYILHRNTQTVTGINPLDSESVATFSQLSIADQINTAVNETKQLDEHRQLLIAETVVNEQVRQSATDALLDSNNPSQLFRYERSFVALKRFYGEHFDRALQAVDIASDNIRQGAIEGFELNLGNDNGRKLNSVQEVFDLWSLDSGERFTLTEVLDSPNVDLPSGDINLLFSTIQTRSGGSISVHSPVGSIDVGLTSEQIAGLGLFKGPAQLGLIAFNGGDINAALGGDIKINQSRIFNQHLLGGDINLWTSFADIDAGRGAKSAADTPPPIFRTDKRNGELTATRVPAIAGSGIRTGGDGDVTLSTPLGIVDAGEAGIDSGGGITIPTPVVRGQDNIKVSADSAGLSAPVAAPPVTNNNSPTREAAAGAAAAGGNDGDQRPTAFVYITLLEDRASQETQQPNPHKKPMKDNKSAAKNKAEKGLDASDDGERENSNRTAQR